MSKTRAKPKTRFAVGERVFYLREFDDIGESTISHIEYGLPGMHCITTADLSVYYHVVGHDDVLGDDVDEPTLFKTWEEAWKQAIKNKRGDA